MVKVTIVIKGDKETKAKLKRLGSSLYDFGSAMREVGKEVGRYYSNEGFNSQGGVFGRPWASLSPKTQAVKMLLYPQFVNVPLVATQTMKNSFVATTGRQSAIITNEAPYYKYHQSTLPRRKIPRRQMAGINDPVKRIIANILEQDIRRKIRAA
jgi:Phage virion morphogenesis family